MKIVKEIMDTISDADQLFGQAARARRNQLGITLEQLAQVSGVSTGALSKIERGRLSPSLRNAVAIAHALGCEVNDLLPTQSTAIHRQQDHLLVTDATNGIVRRTLARPSVDIELLSYSVPTGAQSPKFPPHKKGALEIFYVLVGSLKIHAGGEVFELYQGDSAVISVDVEHWFFNSGNTTAEFTLLILDTH